MSIEFFIYLASLSDELKPTLKELFGLAFSIVSLIWMISYAFEIEELDRMRIKLRTISIGLFSLFLSVHFIPSAQTMYLIAAAKYGQESLQSDTAKKVKTILDDKLDEMLKTVGDK